MKLNINNFKTLLLNTHAHIYLSFIITNTLIIRFGDFCEQIEEFL